MFIWNDPRKSQCYNFWTMGKHCWCQLYMVANQWLALNLRNILHHQTYKHRRKFQTRLACPYNCFSIRWGCKCIPIQLATPSNHSASQNGPNAHKVENSLCLVGCRRQKKEQQHVQGNPKELWPSCEVGNNHKLLLSNLPIEKFPGGLTLWPMHMREECVFQLDDLDNGGSFTKKI